ncbi:hypothetical protein GZH53_18165 [Flavihumibacter sp. R14]|nr:hypothetical protein [Flavihumibacter soli]
MKVKDYVVRALKKGYRVISQRKFQNPFCDTDRQSANDKIYNLLIDDSPCMIARFGTVELICINNYLCINRNEPYLKKIWNYIFDKTHLPWWFEDHFTYMNECAGIFPPTKEIAKRFSERYLDDIPFIDLLGSFQYYEKFMPLRDDIRSVHLETLYPFFVDRPWTSALKGKRVLVVHPFEETIHAQFKNRTLLFNHAEILPEFELITMQAIQSAAGIKVPYENWFEALEHMENQISSIDFDICIIGCGAYGLPLAAHVKRLGKKAFHLGGGTQLLFGIKGKRWDDPNYGNEYKLPQLFDRPYQSLYNPYWIRPLDADTPKTAAKVEGACYW